MKKTTINIFSENIHESIKVNQKKAIDNARNIFKEYLEQDFINNSAIAGFEFDTISFDILYCNNEKTHSVNKEYRNKDYIADIITFAIFADSEEKFVFDGEINLGEIIISLDKVNENSQKNSTSFEHELYFLISHGIMHLLGFDHQTEEDYNFVVTVQNQALQELNL